MIEEDMYDEATKECMDVLVIELSNGDSTRYFTARLDSNYSHSLEGHSLLFSLTETFVRFRGPQIVFQMFYPPDNDSSVFLAGGFELLPLQSSYTANGNVFDSVIISRQLASNRNDISPIETVFAHGVGIISWSTNTGERWELEKHLIK